MIPANIFINRRKGDDRRYDIDPCQAMPIDLYHRKRRKSSDRRTGRTLVEDYYAFLQNTDPMLSADIQRVCASDNAI